jgi:hypothetical protein
MMMVVDVVQVIVEVIVVSLRVLEGFKVSEELDVCCD